MPSRGWTQVVNVKEYFFKFKDKLQKQTKPNRNILGKTKTYKKKVISEMKEENVQLTLT